MKKVLIGLVAGMLLGAPAAQAMGPVATNVWRQVVPRADVRYVNETAVRTMVGAGASDDFYGGCRLDWQDTVHVPLPETDGQPDGLACNRIGNVYYVSLGKWASGTRGEQPCDVHRSSDHVCVVP